MLYLLKPFAFAALKHCHGRIHFAEHIQPIAIVRNNGMPRTAPRYADCRIFLRRKFPCARIKAITQHTVQS